MELDHLFICTSAGAPEVAQLVQLGLTEGRSNWHPGQGTACRRFFFHNAYLEFLWIHDATEAQSASARPLSLGKRWRYQQTGASPFGRGFRPDGQRAEPTALPFESWAYRPAYLPPALQIDIAENSAYQAEPLLFHMSFGSRPDRYPVEREQPLEHSIGFREVTELRVSLPEAKLSRALAALAAQGLVKVSLGATHLAEVTFDQGHQGELTDFRPGLPLVFRW